MIKILQPDDFNSSQFTTGNNVSLRISEQQGNALITKNDGLYVSRESNFVYYTLEKISGSVTVDDSDGRGAMRRRLTLYPNGMGIINLAFRINTTNRTEMFRLPSGCPRPVSQAVCQTHNGGNIWIEADSDIIVGSQLPTSGLICANFTIPFNIQ